MIGAETLPADLLGTDGEILLEIAGDAVQAAFGSIAASLERRGYPVTGDIDPIEAEDLDRLFSGFVREMALNNPTIAVLNSPSARVELEGLEACAPEALFSHEWPLGLDAVEILGLRQSSSSAGHLCNLRGTREAVRSFYLLHWGGGSDNDSVEYDLQRMTPLPEEVTQS